MPEPKRSLHSKLAEVMVEAERIPKNGQYQGQGAFKYVMVGDAADAIRKALGSRGVSMLPTAVELTGETEHATRSGGTMTTLTVRTTWTLTDGETGETAVIQSLGTGADSGDKASPKAQTNAMKYALLMGFLLSTGDDPEQTDTSDRQRPAPARLPPREDPATRDPLEGFVPVPNSEADPKEPYREQEEMVGRASRRGMIRAGTSDQYKMDIRQGPEGPVLGFKLEVGPEKNIPQCVLSGPLAASLIAAYPDPKKLIGTSAKVAGILYHVRGPRSSWYRLQVDRFENDEYIFPPDPADGPVPEPVEAPSVPLFDEDEQAKIDAALAKVPA